MYMVSGAKPGKLSSYARVGGRKPRLSLNWFMDFIFNLPSLFFSPFCQSTVFKTWTCICSSSDVTDGTYGRTDCAKAHIGHGSGWPKGAALTHTKNI